MKPRIFVLGIVILTTSTALAQSSNLTVHFFGAASLPNGDFAKNIGDNARMTRRSGFDIGDKVGLAQTGFGGGVELIAPVWFKGLSWIFGARTFVNGTDAGAIQSEMRSQLGDTVAVEFDFGQWLNIPILTGFRYDLQILQKHRLYGTLQAGVNWSKAAPRKATLGSLTVEDTQYDFARDFGFEVGMGLILNRSFNIGFRYLALSTPRYEGTRKLSEKMFPEIFKRENAILGEERSISMFIVTLGVQLFK